MLYLHGNPFQGMGVNTSDVKEIKETTAISKRDEIIINIVFIGVLFRIYFWGRNWQPDVCDSGCRRAWCCFTQRP